MPTYTGTGGNDTLTGSADGDTFFPLLGRDIVHGLAGSDTLIVDYSNAPYDPYAGAGVPGDMISTVTSTGGSFSGMILGGSAQVEFFDVEHLQVTLNFWQDRFILDAAAVALGATVSVNGGNGIDTLQMDLSALSGVTLQTGVNGLTAGFGTFINFENYAMNLTEVADNVTTGAGHDTLTGNGGDDVLSSGGGHDVLSGGSGSNSLNAGEGDDQIISTGVDTVDGGTGFDRWSGNYGWLTSDFSMARNQAAGTATLSVGTTLVGVERIESIVTGSGNDVFIFGLSETISIDAGAGLDSLTLTGNGFSGELTADGTGAFRGFLGYDRFSSIESLTFTSGDGADMISVDAAPLLSGATLSLNAAGGGDTLILDLSAMSGVSFVVAADGTVTSNVPATLLNFEHFRITASVSGDTIITGAGNDEIRGNGGNDAIETGGGSDLLDGGAGVDSMIGGNGSDVYIVDDAGDTVTEQAGEGIDEIRTSLASFSIAAIASVEILTGTSDAGQVLTGNALANNITGGAGNDWLIGGGGSDFLQGRAGNDIYFVTDAATGIIESDGWGNDTVYSTVSYVLAVTSYAEIETLAVYDAASTDAIDLTGNTRNQSIFGNAGANFLTGGGGTDIMHGLGGNDTYHVDSADDQVIELAGGGADTIHTVASFVLASGSEVETVRASDDTFYPLNLTGNGFGQSLFGNAGSNMLIGGGGADVMQGLGGNDVYVVDSADDEVIELTGDGTDSIYTSVSYTLADAAAVETLTTRIHAGTDAITLIGNAFAQTLIGNAGANTLDGRGGADVMAGLAGNDTYVVDRLEDQVLETVGGGNDTVFTAISFVLSSNQEIETLTTQTHAGTDNLFLTGNQLNNILIGNAGDNLLNGVAGADTMYGLAGNDTYVIDNAGDLVIDLVNQGNDLVYTYLSHTLSNGNQIETLSTVAQQATDAINLGGNDYDNTLIGNFGANYINGGGGVDVMYGLGGDDTYVIENALDQVVEGAGGGSDTLFSFVSYVLAAGQQVEAMSTAGQGATTAIDLTGNELGQIVVGNAGSNILDGKSGSDTLHGLGGADFFAFTTALGAGNVDTLADFSVADDTIQLDDAIFAALGGLGTLTANAFVAGAGAADADDRIVYNSATGALLYDADGTGGTAAVQFATLAAGLALTASDFQVI